MQLIDRSPQSTKVLRELVRYIHGSGLQPGDKLPSQSEIRKMFGFHNTTLDSAMETLVLHGVVNRRKKAGTVLINKDFSLRGLWNVGLALLSATTQSEPFYGQLLHLIQTYLNQNRLFIRQYMLEPLVRSDDTRISKFPHLIDDLSDGALDAVLSLSYIPEADWKLWGQRSLFIHVGSWEDAPCGVVIEQGVMVSDAVDRVVAQGGRRLAIVSIKGYSFQQPRFWPAFVEATTRHGLYRGREQHFAVCSGPMAGWDVAEAILARPPQERPDALIVVNDAIAAGIAASLAGQSDYRPLIVAQTNRQAPLAFALPVIKYELDMNELAREAVEMLMARLYNPELPPERKWVHPRLSHECPFA